MSDEIKTETAPGTPANVGEKPSNIPPEEMSRLTDEIVGALKTVFDPEIPADIYELGLIYKVDIDDDSHGQHRYDADNAELPGRGRITGTGRECSGRRSWCARGQGQYRVGSAMGPEPDVGRGAHDIEYVVSCARSCAALEQRHYMT